MREPAATGAVGTVRANPDCLSETLGALARKHRVPGAQLAVHRDGETLALEVGELEHGTGDRVGREAAFPIGSISKSFTATVAMVLVADDDLELDAPVGAYLPELRGGAGEAGGQPTLRQLLSHTSGLGEGPDSAKVAALSLRRYVQQHCRRPDLVLPPGAGFSYSNIGYALVGRLIEVITGMDWWEAVESILLRPLGIEPSFVVAAGPRPPGRPIATGHSVNISTGRTRPVEQSLALAEAPAGGLAVSAVDLVRLSMTQLDGRTPAFLPPSCAEQMRQAVPGAEPFGMADGWGLGLALFRSGDTVWVGHDGNADGTACYLRVDPAGAVVAFTSNANLGFAMWRELVSGLGEAGLPIGNHVAPQALGDPVAPPPDCLGIYVNGDTEYSVTEQESGDLGLTVDGEAVARLVLHEGLTFSQHDWASGQPMPPGRFLRDPATGALDLLQVNGRTARRVARARR